MSRGGSPPIGGCTAWAGSYADGVDFAAEFLDESRAFGDVVLSAAQDTPVPTCPGWTLKQLFRHVGRGDRWAAQIIAEGTNVDPAAVPSGKPPDDLEGALQWLLDGSRLLVDAAACGTRCRDLDVHRPPAASWWVRRRLQHETTVHRADAAITSWRRVHARWRTGRRRALR